MRRLLAVVVGTIVLVLGMPALAAEAVYTYQDKNGDSARLLPEPCATASGWLKLRRAVLRYQGRELEACWFALRGEVILLDAEGDAMPLPQAVFRKEEST